MEKYSWSKWIWWCSTYAPFDTINHDLLIAKLGAYGFDIATLKLIRSYLMNCFQRAKVNTLLLGLP